MDETEQDLFCNLGLSSTYMYLCSQVEALILFFVGGSISFNI